MAVSSGKRNKASLALESQKMKTLRDWKQKEEIRAIMHQWIIISLSAVLWQWLLQGTLHEHVLFTTKPYSINSCGLILQRYCTKAMGGGRVEESVYWQYPLYEQQTSPPRNGSSS